MRELNYVDVSKSLVETKLSDASPAVPPCRYSLDTGCHGRVLLCAAGREDSDPRSTARRTLALSETINPADPGLGDIVAMLKPPSTSRLYTRESLPPLNPSARRTAHPGSRTSAQDILVLGDSFFNIFSLAEWGGGFGRSSWSNSAAH